MDVTTKLHNATLRTPKRVNADRVSVDGDAMPKLSGTNSLHFKVQINGGQTSLKYGCVNTVANQILTADDQDLRLWTLRKEIKRATLGAPCIGVVHVTSANFYIVGHQNSEISLWWPSLRKFYQKKLTLSTAKDDMVAIAFSQKRMELITSEGGGALVIWLLKNKDLLPNKKRKTKNQKIQAPEPSGPYANKWVFLPRCSFFNNTGVKLLEVDEQHGFLLGASDSSIRIWDQKSANMLKDYASVNLSQNTTPITSLYYDSTNKYCLVGYENGQVMVWHLDVELVVEGKDTKEEDANNTQMLTGHTRAVTALSIVPTVPGTRANAFLTCGAEGRILQWDIKNFQHHGAFQFKFPSTSVDGVSINEKLRPFPRQMMMMKVETHNFVKNVIVVMAGNSLVVLESRASQKPLLKLTGDIVSMCVRDDINNDSDKYASPRTSSLPVPPADHINAQHLVCMTADETVVVLDPDLENNSMHIQESFSCQPTALTQLPAPEFAQTKVESQFIHVNKGRRKGPQRIRAGRTINSMKISAVPRTMVCRWDARLQLFVLGRSDGSVHLVNSQREVVTSFDGGTDSNAITALCTAVSIKHQRTAKPGVMLPPMSFVVYATAEGTLSAHPIVVVLPKALRDPTTVPSSVSFVAHSSPVVSVMQMPLTPVGLGSGCIVTVEAAGAVKIWSPPPKLGARGLFTATGRGAFVGAKITAATLIEHPSTSSVSILIGFESGALWAWRVPASLELPKTAEANHPTAHRRRISALEWLNSSSPLVDSQGLVGPRLFVSASLDQSIKLWNADKFEQLRSFTTTEPDAATFYFSPPRDGARELHILMTSEKSIFSVFTGYSEPLATRQVTSLPRAHTPPRVSRSVKTVKTEKHQQQLQQLAANAPSTIVGSPRSAYSSDREMAMSASYMGESMASLFTDTWDRKASTLSPMQHPSSVPALAENTSNWAAKSGMFAGVAHPKRLGRLVPINNTAPANNLAGLQPADLASINSFNMRRPATTDPNRRLSTRNKKLIRVTFDEYGRKVKHEVDLASIYENPKIKKHISSDTLKKMYKHVPSRIDTNNKRNVRKVPHAVKGVPFPYAFRSLWLVPDVDEIVTYSQPHSRGVKAFTKTVKKKGSYPTLGLSESPMTVSATVAQVWGLYILRLQAQKQQAARRNLRGKLKGATVSRVMKRRYIKHHEDTFANFVYQTFQRRAGVQILAQERLLRLLDSLLLHQAHPACELCGRFFTLFGQMSHLKEETFRIFGSIMLPLFNENKLWSPPDHNTADLVTAQSKPAPELSTMYVSVEDFINQASACLSGFIDPVFLHNVLTIIHNLPQSEYEGMVSAHSAFLGFLDLWEKRRKVEITGSQVLFRLSRRVSSEAQSEEQQRRRYLGIQGLHSLLKQFLLMDRERVGAIKRADFSDLLTHSSLMAGCTQRELDTILEKFSVVDFNTVAKQDEDLVLIPYQHLWLTLRSLLTQVMPALVSPVSAEIKIGLECIIIDGARKGAFQILVNNHSEIEEYYASIAGNDYERQPLYKRHKLECTINPGGANEEHVQLVGFGTAVQLHDALRANHKVGEVVRVLPTQEWIDENRPPQPNIPKQLPLLAHAAHLQTLEMLPGKNSTDYRRFDSALQGFQSAVYLGDGKPDPLPSLFAIDTKEPVKIIDASINAKVQPRAEGVSVENTEPDPSAETATETKTVDSSKVTTEAEGTAPAEIDGNADMDSETTVTPVPTVAAMVTDELTRAETPRAKSKKPIPLWDRLTRTSLQSKRAAQVEREQKVDAGPAGGSLDLTMTLGSQPQSDLYLDITPKLQTERRGMVPEDYSGPLDGVLQFHRPPLRARIDQLADSHLMVASRFRKDPLYLKPDKLNPLANNTAWPKDLRNNFVNYTLGIQIITPHVFLYFENWSKQRKLVRALQDCFFGIVKTERIKHRMQIPLSFLPLLLTFMEHVGIILPPYIYDMAKKVRELLMLQSRGSETPSNADAVLARMFDGVDVDSFSETGNRSGVLMRKLLTPAQQKVLRESRYRHALALLAREVNWGPPYTSYHVNEDDLDRGGDGTKQKSEWEAMDPRERAVLEKAEREKRDREAKAAAAAEYARLLEQQRLEAIALAERQRIADIEQRKRDKEAELKREAAERIEMGKTDLESANENTLFEVGYFDLGPEVLRRLNMSGNAMQDLIKIKEKARQNGMAPKHWMSITLQADRQQQELERKMKRLAKAQGKARKFLKKIGKSTAKKARAVVWLQKRGKHAARQALAEKELRATGRPHMRKLAHRAREIKVQRYSATKFLIKIGRHAAKRAKAEVFLRGLGQTHAKALAMEAKREKFAADLKARREEALDYLNQLSQYGLKQCRAQKHLRDLGKHWAKTFKAQAEAKTTLQKMADIARARAGAEVYLREAGEQAIQFIKVMIMLEKQKQKPPPKPKKKKPPPLTPRKEKSKNKLARLRNKLGGAMRLAKVGKDHRISERERMKTQMLMMAKIKRFRNRIADADILRNNPVHDVKPLPDAVTIKVLNFNENIQVRSLLSMQNDTYLPQWTPEENNDASDEEFDALLEEDLQDATTAQHRRFHSSPVLVEGGVTINMTKKDDLHWKEFFNGEAKKIHDTMTGMFDETEDSSDRPVVAATYAKLKKHLEEQEATDRAKKRKDAIRRKRRKAKADRERSERAVNYFEKNKNIKDDILLGATTKSSSKASREKRTPEKNLTKQRDGRRQRAEALRNGTIRVTKLAFDEWKTASCLVGKVSYFSVFLPEKRPLIVNVDVKRGSAKLFMSAGELPTETDSTWSANQYTIDTHSHIAMYPDDRRYESNKIFYIGVCCGSNVHTRFRIQASCLQVAESEITTSSHMKNAAANMEKIQTVYSRLRPSVDDPDENDELDAIEAELEAGLLSAGIVTLDQQRVKKKSSDLYEDDDTSDESDDGFSDVSSVDSLPTDLKNRYIEFNTSKN